MMAFLALWLGLFGLVLFESFGKDFAKENLKIWLMGSAIVATMLAVPFFLVLLAAAKILTR